MVDPKTGFVYETEDSGDCGFYRFVPYSRGKLIRGGKLYMMSVKDQPNADLGGNIPVGTTWDVRWVRIDDPAATSTSCFGQGSAKGGARFRRLEGAWWGDGVGYFVSTDGGSVARGTTLRVRPARRDAEAGLRFSRRDRARQPGQHRRHAARRHPVLRRRRGGTNVAAERLVGLTEDGEAFTFGINNVNLAGGLQQPRAGGQLHAAANGRAPATVPTGAGCSSTSRRRVSRSRSPVPGDTGRSRMPWPAGRRPGRLRLP